MSRLLKSVQEVLCSNKLLNGNLVLSSLKPFWTMASGLFAARLLQVSEASLWLVQHFERPDTGCMEETGK